MRRNTTVTVEIGRVDDNGVKKCLLSKGATVEELIDQSGLFVDDDKETIIAKSTGEVVDFEDELVDGETYMIAPEVKSA